MIQIHFLKDKRFPLKIWFEICPPLHITVTTDTEEASEQSVDIKTRGATIWRSRVEGRAGWGQRWDSTWACDCSCPSSPCSWYASCCPTASPSCCQSHRPINVHERTRTRLTQPRIPPCWGNGRNATSAGRQVTLCDPMWHVANCHTHRTLLIYMFMCGTRGGQPRKANSRKHW